MKNLAELSVAKIFKLCILFSLFRQLDAVVCSQPEAEKVECGFLGIDYDKCVNLGCCYDSLSPIPCFLPGSKIQLHKSANTHISDENITQKYQICQYKYQHTAVKVQGIHIWTLYKYIQTTECLSTQQGFSIQEGPKFNLFWDFNDLTQLVMMSPLIPEKGENMGGESHMMIDSICDLGGLTVPKRYETCSNLTSTNFEQKFLYQIYEPSSSKVKVEVRGENFACSTSDNKPFVIVYSKAYDQYFKANDLWSGEFISCSLIDSNEKCSYECFCQQSICKMIYLKWMINYDKELFPLSNVTVCDINVVAL
ncbi:DgyrCDS14842 [Dimorphilus gyrociliatus]|uniref:DgyrCDS14842 n=1 Tax=Dimorphilus gyrociliatus TaxID=2664684 RepID=A0A7I8WF27_9ANNE|nr:DgyrCDS14842 [Dimorphilus gyrociliatus]